MTALLIVLAAIVLLFIGYVFYGSWLAKQWVINLREFRVRKYLINYTSIARDMGLR